MQSISSPFGIQFGFARQYGKQLCLTLLLSVAIGVSYFLPRGHDDQRMLQLALLGTFAVWALVSRGGAGIDIWPAQRELRWSLSGFFLLGALSSAFAFSPRHAILEVAIFLMLLMLALGVAREVAQDSARYVPLVLKVCAVGSVLYLVEVAVIYAAALVFGAQPSLDDFTPGFNNIRFFNHAQTVSLPMLVLLCLLTKPREKAGWVYFSIAACWWTLLFVTAGRGTFVGLAAGCAGALLLRRQHAFAFCKTMLLTALAGGAVYILFFVLVPIALGYLPFGDAGVVVRRTVADPASLRGPLWWRAIDLIAAHPWLGAGPLHYAHYAIDLQNGAHPHDWLLQIGAEWGLPALACLIVAVGCGFVRLVRSAGAIAVGDRGNQNMLAAWIATGLAILVDALVSGSLVMPVSQLFIALYIGCAAGWLMSFSRGAALTPQAAYRRPIAAVLLLLALAGVAIGIAPEIGGRIRGDAEPASEAGWYNGVYHPRIWMAGYF